ncbi:MAG: DUF481 domain-containing protein [Candidatus Kapaibacterium sp.]
MKIFLLILLFVSVGALKAQVNTESLRKDEAGEGFYQIINFKFGLNDGNSEYLELGAGLRSDYYSGKFYSFLTGNLSYKQGEENTLVSKGFLHLRGIYRFHDILYSEAFFQEEFNEFILLINRELAGAGLRINAISVADTGNPMLDVFTGTGIMYESEHLNLNPNTVTDIIRSTNYLSVDWKSGELLSLQSVTYYQFAFEDLNNYRILNESSFNISLSENFIFNVKFEYRFDNQPPSGLEKYDLSLYNGITVKF